MGEVTLYKHWMDGDLTPDEDGDWVSYADYADVVDERDELRARLGAAREAWWKRARPWVLCPCMRCAAIRTTMDTALSGEEVGDATD